MPVLCRLVRRFHPRLLAVVLLIAAVASDAEARQGSTVSGRLIHSVTAAPVENASIVITTTGSAANPSSGTR